MFPYKAKKNFAITKQHHYILLAKYSALPGMQSEVVTAPDRVVRLVLKVVSLGVVEARKDSQMSSK